MIRRFENFDIDRKKEIKDHVDRMNLRREDINNLKDYFIELSDDGDSVDIKKETGVEGQYIITITSFKSDIEERINWKRLNSKYEIRYKNLRRLKLRGRSNVLEIRLTKKDLKCFEDWSGTIKVGQKEIDKLWKYSAKMPQRFFNYIQKEISPVECVLEGNTIKIGGPGTKLCEAEMSAGFNMFRTIKISEITIWLSFGSGNLSEDGYFNITIWTSKGEYLFTSETIEDLCEFLNRIFKEGVIEFNEPD